MPKQDNEFLSALEARTRSVCLDLVRENPDLTVGDIQALCRGQFGRFISAITLGELFSGPTEPAASAGRKPQAAKPPTKANNRTPARTKAPRTKPPKVSREKPAKVAPDNKDAADTSKPTAA